MLFLTGEDEIEQACAKIAAELQGQSGKEVGPVMCVPLYSALPPHEQQKVFDAAPGPKEPGGPPGRKIVVSTNIAEVRTWLFAPRPEREKAVAVSAMKPLYGASLSLSPCMEAFRKLEPRLLGVQHRCFCVVLGPGGPRRLPERLA